MESAANKQNMTMQQSAVLAVFCAVLLFLGSLILLTLEEPTDALSPAADVQIMEQFDRLVSEDLLLAKEHLNTVPKRFWLDDDAQQGPIPDPRKFGITDDPSTLGWLWEDAETLLDGQKTVFSIDTELLPGSQVTYYLDDTIFAITWKQPIDKLVYTVSEIKVSHPSQFRRHLADNTFASENRYTPSQMSQAVNAVVGTSADHYMGRDFGIIVYDGKVRRSNHPGIADVCFVDQEGNLLLKRRGELMDADSAQKYVEEHNIDFSLAFGPILIEDGEACTPAYYPLGEINDNYARAALCQVDELHYLVVTANYEDGYYKLCNIHTFAKNLATLGCEKAYALDGGNTGAIVMNGKLINRTQFGEERLLGDIIYFCTAIPNTNE